MELQELPDGVVNVPAPEHGLDDRGEVVIQENDRGSLLGHFSSSDTHGESYIGLLKGRGIIGAIPSDSHHMSPFLKTSDQTVLVFRSASGQDIQVGVDLVEFVSIGNSVLPHLLLLFLGRLFISRTVTDHGLAVDTDDATHPVDELYSFHDDALGVTWLDDVAFLGNGLGSQLVVSSHHTHLDASLATVHHTLRHFLPENILDAQNADKGESTLFDLVNTLSILGAYISVAAHI